MRYAVISDIHGNVYALKAVLADAIEQNIDRYILLGDYAIGFPLGNEAVDILRNLSNSHCIRGNGEGYFDSIKGSEPDGCIFEQLKPIYWAYNTMSFENHKFLMSLPKTLILKDEDLLIHVSHSSDIFYRNPSIGLFHPKNFNEIMKWEPFTHEEYLVKAKEALLASSEVIDDILSLQKGVYLFGHNHLQFHMEYEGRLFINPGSCGEPLNWDTAATYTILEIKKGRAEVIERRVEYDLDKTIDSLYQSGYSNYAPVWSKLMEKEIGTGVCYFSLFILHLSAIAKKHGLREFPVSNEVWLQAVKMWDICSSL